MKKIARIVCLALLALAPAIVSAFQNTLDKKGTARMKLISATILFLTCACCLFSQAATNNVPLSDERAIRLENAPLFICLDVYSELTGKKVKDETTTRVGGITFRTESSIPKGELAKQMEACLKEKGVALIPSGTNELKAVTINAKVRVQQRVPSNPHSPSAQGAGGRQR